MIKAYSQTSPRWRGLAKLKKLSIKFIKAEKFYL